ncbi:MAG: glycosyltransferase family 2 protein [Chloroflexaceae bacterium]|nr:glycosyltransferase family 2 protein [Chloroflexaceae bacterium]
MSRAVVLVLTWNGTAYIRACLDALAAQQGCPEYGVLVVDNASSDDTANIVAAEYPDVALIRNPTNLGFAQGNNVGLQAVLDEVGPAAHAPDVIVLLNQDTTVAPDWLAQLLAAFEQYPNAGILGCKIYDPDGRTLQHTGGSLSFPLATPHHRGAGKQDDGQYDTPELFAYVTGAAMAIRRTVIEQIGGLDAGFTPAYFEDTDFCFRARTADFDVLYVPTATLHHAEGARSQSAAHQRRYHRNRVRFVLRHCPLDLLVREFEAAEQEELLRWSLSNSLARKHAYLDNLLHLAAVLAQRSDAADALQHHALLAAMLHRLHQTTVDEERHRRTEAVRLPDAASEPEPAPPAPQPELLTAPQPEPPTAPQPEPPTLPTPAPPTASEPEPEPAVDVAAIMRQVRRQISMRQSKQTDYDLQAAIDALNQQWDHIYAPLELPASDTLTGQAWAQLSTRLHHEVRSYLDPMIFRQTEFNANLVRALNHLLHRTSSSASMDEIEALRDEIIQLREQVRQLQEQREQEP